MSGLTWDDFLRFWAVLGTLIVAAGGAVWARRLQREEREFAERQERQRLDREEVRQREMLVLQAARADIGEARSAYARFLTAAGGFLIARRRELNQQSDDNAAKTVTALEEFNECLQTVCLLGTREAVQAASSLWDAANAVSSVKDADKDSPEGAQYVSARLRLLDVGRHHVGAAPIRASEEG